MHRWTQECGACNSGNVWITETLQSMIQAMSSSQISGRNSQNSIILNSESGQLSVLGCGKGIGKIMVWEKEMLCIFTI